MFPYLYHTCLLPPSSRFSLCPNSWIHYNEPVQFQAKEAIEIRDLEPESFFYPVLRKPDFQRETADWTPEKIVDLVQSYLDGDLIPAIILWKSNDNHVFVIDG